MAEFGGSLVDDSIEAEAARDDVMTSDPDMSAGTTGDGIELEEVQPQPQSVERTPRPSVSLLRMSMGLADQTELSRGVIWNAHIAIDADCFRAPFIRFRP